MMNIMTDYQRDLVLGHLDLVTQVIRKRIKVNGCVMLTFDDFYSVGCEALCHAAMRYTPARGEFSPFAAVLIYNAIIDHCRKHNRLMNTHSDLPTEPDIWTDLGYCQPGSQFPMPDGCCGCLRWVKDLGLVSDRPTASL